MTFARCQRRHATVGYGTQLQVTLRTVVLKQTVAQHFGQFTGSVAAQHVHLP